MPKNTSPSGIVIELKAKKVDETTSLEALAESALQQIDQKKYTSEFAGRGILGVMKIAIAFQGKQFALSSAEEKK